MYKLDVQLARDTMLATFGPDRYMKFVVALNGRCQQKRRMFFWQDEMWNQVQEQLGVRINDFSTITGLFRFCHVHNEELRQELVPIGYGTRQATGNYIEAMESKFPYANEVYFGPSWHEKPKHCEVYFCDACRAAKNLWQDQLPD
ncbi:hypothetical protein ACN9MZ_06180 [Pseudoduganella sp. S-14]|jgi:hypothetical protein|uniref:hypothetical protein n=1 Tax=Pseudoduganella sp. S-14 TaxID=3404065 RepID=UPI003CEEFF84